MAASHKELTYLVLHRPLEAKRRIRSALRKCDGNVEEAARVLGVGKSSLYGHLGRLQLSGGPRRKRATKSASSSLR